MYFEIDQLNGTAGLRTEPMSILVGSDERLDHLGVLEVATELIQLAQPEVVALIVESRFGRIIRVPLQITKVLHENERFINQLVMDRTTFADTAQRRGATSIATAGRIECINCCRHF